MARPLAWALAALVSVAAATHPAAPAKAAEEVDLALVLAVDISFSMDEDEQRLQRLGYIQALRSNEFLGAVGKGLTGRIIVTYVEWAGTNSREVVVPWQIIDGPDSAERFVSKLVEMPPKRAYRTSISNAIDFAVEQFGRLDVHPLRKVIDVSGDGPNNQGRPVTLARDEAVAQGITINGLPLMLKEPGYLDITQLDRYYEQCVIGGPGAFMLPVRDRAQFIEATRQKLLLEVSDARIGPTLARDTGSGDLTSCMAGERLWDQRMGN